MDIQWYPGHMAKARRVLSESLKLVDVVVELLDARAPLSSRNPDFEELFAGKRRLLVLNKADLADAAATRSFVKYYQNQGFGVLAFSALEKRAVAMAAQMVRKAAEDLVARSRGRGMNKTVRAMTVGIPNVGKSTFINRLRGGAPARASDRPGVTRGKQWIIIDDHLEFYDTPGMLWPKLEDKEAAVRLAFLGSVRDDIMDIEELSCRLLDFLMEKYPKQASARFKLQGSGASGYALLEEACRGRGWLISGGRPDTARGAAVVIDEFRAGKLGPVTLDEVPPEEVPDAGDAEPET
jgi:ribosome biogenesis GTPase A